MAVPSGDVEARSTAADVLECCPVATMTVARVVGDADGGRVLSANAAARRLLGGDPAADLRGRSIFDLVDARSGPALRSTLTGVAVEPVGRSATMIAALRRPVDAAPVEGLGDGSFVLNLLAGPGGDTTVQLTRCHGWDEVDRVLLEQQRFRGALMELSELAYTTQDDDEFYQRLIERAVEVVPGAQGGSVQLNVPGTVTFRFVAAVGFDMEGLKRHVLDQQHFFRDAWNPSAKIVRDFTAEGRSPEISQWLETYGRLSEIVVNVSAPVLSGGLPVAFLSLDNFEDPDAMNETSVEMTTVLGRLIGELWRRRELEAEIRKEREAYRHLALHDALTGLANRRYLERTMGEALSSEKRRHHPWAVLFVDIDDFKGVNDRLGHAVGDRLLVGVAHGLNEAVRAGDIVGRWGGDEFLVIPQRVDSVDQAMALAGRVLEQFETDLDLECGISHRARLTVGVGWSNDGETDFDSLVRAADEALYEAKAAGKGVARMRTV